MHGVRVFEMHPGSPPHFLSHGLHIHMVVDCFLPVDVVRAISTRKGFGRINVKRIPASRALYVAKYLSKPRCEAMKGMRLWSPVNFPEAHAVRDIVVESRWVDSYRFLASSIRGFSRISWQNRLKIVGHFMFGEPVGRLLHVQNPFDRQTEQEAAEEFDRICQGIDEGRW
jgi:hypothetical protein